MNYEIKPPYVNLYKASEGFNKKPAWSAHNSMNVYSIDACTWSTCGGHGLHEVKDIQSGYGYYGHSMWGGAYGAFVEIDDMYFLAQTRRGRYRRPYFNAGWYIFIVIQVQVKVAQPGMRLDQLLL